jgi:hypothetical protein
MDSIDERSVLQDFAAKHPELLNVDLPADIRNKEIIVDLLVKGSGLPLTLENLELAYQVALKAGEITLGMYSRARIRGVPANDDETDGGVFRADIPDAETAECCRVAAPVRRANLAT